MKSRSPPPIAIAMPVAEACTAPQAPSAKPLWPCVSRFIAAVSVATENRPPPKPMSAAPARNIKADCSGSAKITQTKATTPESSPIAASRYTSPP
jgi:hypothetical protein